MANNITDVAELLMLDWINAVGSPTRPPGLKLRLMTADGSDSAGGTELGASGGYSAGGSAIVFDAAAAGAAVNQVVAFTNMPAATITGIEIWDTSGSPRRLWWGPLTASKTTASGDTLSFAAGSISLALN